jgi:deoxyribodipyrimidine photo-lyase
MADSEVPRLRVRSPGDRAPRGNGEHVLYWMIAARRPGWNFGLQRAADWARELGKPLVVLEALRCDYPWASDRLHRFVIDGMRANAAAFAGRAAYHAYVEPREGAGSGLLAALAERAAVVVTDEFPCFFLPRMVAAAASRIEARFEVVDSNGLLPLRVTDRDYPTASAFRRFLQRELPRHLEELPDADPLRGLPPPVEVPAAVRERWPSDLPRELAALPIDHEVAPAPTEGGPVAGGARLAEFLEHGLPRYAEERNQPELDVASRLSPYLHFGHVSAHQVFHALAEREGWHPGKLSDSTAGKRAGWWGMGEAAESFLDELVTWREVGYNMCWQRKDYDRYESLPGWAQTTLAEHADDPRDHLYSLEQFERAATHDELWNAAQSELLREGRIHNYLRMLWGKKILEWTRSPREALAVMVELNNKYALDGRNPNSYSGIFWVLGRYDRAWGPVRPVFGKIRFMSSANTARKVRVKEYVGRYGGSARS